MEASRIVRAKMLEKPSDCFCNSREKGISKSAWKCRIVDCLMYHLRSHESCIMIKWNIINKNPRAMWKKIRRERKKSKVHLPKIGTYCSLCMCHFKCASRWQRFSDATATEIIVAVVVINVHQNSNLLHRKKKTLPTKHNKFRCKTWKNVDV